MTYLIKEITAQHIAQTQKLLAQRRRGRIGFLAAIYILIVLAGFLFAAFVAGPENVKNPFYWLLGSIAAISCLIVVMRTHIKQTERSLDISLDTLAASRVMAMKENTSTLEQEELSVAFKKLQDERVRGLFGRKRYLI